MTDTPTVEPAEDLAVKLNGFLVGRGPMPRADAVLLINVIARIRSDAETISRLEAKLEPEMLETHVDKVDAWDAAVSVPPRIAKAIAAKDAVDRAAGRAGTCDYVARRIRALKRTEED